MLYNESKHNILAYQGKGKFLKKELPFGSLSNIPHAKETN
jgi:hypothetical protein